MWDVMLSQPHTLEKVLRELAVKLQDQRLRRVFISSTEDACIHHLAVSDRASPASASGLCLPAQEKRQGPLPSRLPPNAHLLQDIRTQPLRARRDLPSTRFPCASPAGAAPLSLPSLFQLLASGSISSEDFAGLYKVQRYLRRPSRALLSLTLTGLVTLSQRPETVSGAQSREAMWAAGGSGQGGGLAWAGGGQEVG